MSLFLKSEISEKYSERCLKQITFIVMGRLRWILPLILGTIIAFTIPLFLTTLWKGSTESFLLMDFAGLIVFGTIYLVYRKFPVITYKDIFRVHFSIQTAVSVAIILYGAAVTVLDQSNAPGDATFIVCLLFVGAMMLMQSSSLFIISFGGVSFIFVIRMFLGPEYQSADYFQEIFLFVCVVIIMLFVNRHNIKTIIASQMSDIELENMVEERTKQLAEETGKAQQSDNLKTVFLANMSHEIRTPLNGILGFTELLKNDALKQEDRHKYLDIVEKSGKNLLEILNGIIEVSRIESGVCELDSGDFILNDVFSEVTDFFKGHEKITSGKIFLVNKAADNPPLTINSDRLKILQILINLISNSIKYSESGIITADFELMNDEVLKIRVTDTGNGINKEDLDIIFNRFHQVSTEPYNHRNGVGLGLTIVKGYAELLGGSIQVDSEPGKGSEFSIVLPVDLQVK